MSFITFIGLKAKKKRARRLALFWYYITRDYFLMTLLTVELPLLSMTFTM